VVSPNETPRDVVNFGRVENLPIALSVALAALASAVLAHMVASSVRRRRHDLAILKTLGLGKRHIRAVVGWQATTLVISALVVGIPAGVVGGRWAWTSLADRVGVVPEPRVSVGALALMVPAAIVIANLVAAIPGRIAARTQPAIVLRAE
jgi:predicted lysophospholipase L1 biosynthesis ABC-type transport system permease subunit